MQYITMKSIGAVLFFIIINIGLLFKATEIDNSAHNANIDSKGITKSEYKDQSQAKYTTEEIKKVINSSYVNGIHNGGPIEDIRDGFHESFVMFRYSNNEVRTTTIFEWINSIENGRERNPDRQIKESKASFKSIQLEGNTASVTLDLMREGNTIFTDHMLLYKFNNGWKIISKTFYRH